MSRIAYFFMVGLMLMPVSCEKVIFSDTGEIVVREQQFDYFSGIAFYDIFDVELVTGDRYAYHLEAPEQFMDRLWAGMDSGTLVFRDSNLVKIMADYPRPKVTVTFPELDGTLLLESPVKLSTPDTLRLTSLKLQSLGKTGEIDLLLQVDQFSATTGSDNAGYYVFRGNAGSVRFWLRGSSIMDASGLKALDGSVFNNSMGDCEVQVSRRLEAKLNAMGNIWYTGDPEEVILLEERGTGKLLKR